MLKIHFGHMNEAIAHPALLFDNSYHRDWFEDPFVKHICKVADNTDVVSAGQMSNPIFGEINCKLLSQGCKNCILAYKLDRVINATLMGDNCGPILMEIAAMKDLTISLEHLFDFSRTENFSALILNNGQIVNSYDEYLDVALDYL